VECDEVVQNLEAYNAGELPEAEALRIADHLAKCSSCELERTELLELASELRRAGEAFRPIRPFAVAAAPVPARRRRTWLVAAGAAAAVWMVLLTAAAFWPSLTEQLTFLPVGRRLADATPAPTGEGGGASQKGYSLSGAPSEALAAVTALFQPSSETRAPSRDAISDQLAELLPDNLGRTAASVRVVSVGPVESVSEGKVRLIATADIGRKDAQGRNEVQRYRFLMAVTRSQEGTWQVSNLQRLTD